MTQQKYFFNISCYDMFTFLEICESDMVRALIFVVLYYYLVLTATAGFHLTFFCWTHVKENVKHIDLCYKILVCLFSWTLYSFLNIFHHHTRYLKAKTIKSKNILCSWVSIDMRCFSFFPFFCSIGHILCWMFWQ